METKKVGPLNYDQWNVTLAYLERVLPTELPYRGHTLKLMPVVLTDLVAVVYYRCDTFFDCPEHNHITGHLLFGRANYQEYLSKTLRQELRRMYWHLEREVTKETAQGCSIRPVANCGSED